jgi:hypothetical protein
VKFTSSFCIFSYLNYGGLLFFYIIYHYNIYFMGGCVSSLVQWFALYILLLLFITHPCSINLVNKFTVLELNVELVLLRNCPRKQHINFDLCTHFGMHVTRCWHHQFLDFNLASCTSFNMNMLELTYDEIKLKHNLKFWSFSKTSPTCRSKQSVSLTARGFLNHQICYVCTAL